jgi:hypothetical protein
MKRLLLFFVMLCATLCFSISAISVGFTSGPLINAGLAAETDDDLICSWGITDTTAINVSWYKDDVLNRTLYDSTSLNTSNTLPQSATAKNQNWRCVVTLFNATHNVTQETNVTIENAGPSTPVLYNGVVDISDGITLIEDQTIILDLNSTDPDPGDGISYFIGSGVFCTVTDSNTGAVSCTATHAQVRNATEGEDNVTLNIIFYASDDDAIEPKSSGLNVPFNITPVNDLPNVTIPDQSSPVNQTFNESFTITDEEEHFPATAIIDVASTSADIVGEIAVTVENESILRIYQTSALDYDAVGNHTVGINITDSLGASILVTYNWEITSVNRPPYFVGVTPANYSSPLPYTYVLAQGETVFINLSANDPDTNLTDESIFFSDDTSLFNVQTSNSTATNISNATGYINFTATNADVGNTTVTITITDVGGFTDTITLNFTVTNINDPPVIYNQSYAQSNTGGNINISNLIAYRYAPFSYQINFSDPDLTIGLDTLSWSDNTSTINVTSTGLISFTPTGEVRNETINISVSDLAGSTDWRLVFLEIRNNSPPFFNQTLPHLNCSEGQSCFLNVSYYADEFDPDDNVSSYAASVVGGSVTGFSIDSVTGVINFTPLQSEIGNYTLNVTIADSRSATAWQLFNLTINNTEDAPVWITYDFSGETIVEDHTFNFLLYADDPDLLLNNSSESLTFSSNLSWVSISPESTTGNRTRSLLSFTPNSTQDGDHVIRLNVTDTTGRSAFVDVSFTIYNDTLPPEVNQFRPYGGVNDALVDGWFENSMDLTVDSVTFPENTTNLIFKVNATDDETPVNQLLYTWYYDSELIQGPSTLNQTNLSFDFLSNGSHQVQVVINDTRLESTTFTWDLVVTDVNRPPRFLVNYTENETIDATARLNGFFSLYDGQKFYDPDDDLDANGLIDQNESFDLTITSTACAHATLEQDGRDLRVTPLSVGTCLVTFTAEDSAGENVTSNVVTIIVTEVPQGAQASSVSSGGGGGGITTRNTLVPIQQEVETPFPLSIVTPGRVTIYENQTVEVPVVISNNWTEPLYGVLLSATSNISDLDMTFDTDYIEELGVGASTLTMLTVEGYRLGENFEVTVHANVSDPELHDSVLVTFNAIEASDADKNAVEVKVTFAQDLLSQNEECQELNEYLREAEEFMREGDLDSSRSLLDFVINGCKFMISRTSPDMQEPGIIRNPFVEIEDAMLRGIAYIILGVFVLFSLVGLLYHHYRTKDVYDF